MHVLLLQVKLDKSDAHALTLDASNVGMGCVVFWGLRLMHRFTRSCNVLHNFQPEKKWGEKSVQHGLRLRIINECCL